MCHKVPRITRKYIDVCEFQDFYDVSIGESAAPYISKRERKLDKASMNNKGTRDELNSLRSASTGRKGKRKRFFFCSGNETETYNLYMAIGLGFECFNILQLLLALGRCI